MVQLRYPKEALHDTTDYLRVDIVSYQNYAAGPNLVRSGAAFNKDVLNPQKVKDLTLSIILPIPSNIQDGNSVSYADSSLDGFTAAVYNVAIENMTGGGRNGTLGSVQSALTNTLKGLADVTILDPDAQKIFTKSLAAQAANIPFGGNLTVSQILARETGQILNPNMELLFNGVTLRSFKFSFKMTPRNQPEAEEIREIIRMFKKSMAPVANDKFLESPLLFELSYRKGPDIHPYLNLFKACFLTDMSVNYTGEGTYATYSDGSPISYIMDLSFKEIEPVYFNNYSGKSDTDRLIPTDKTVGF